MNNQQISLKLVLDKLGIEIGTGSGMSDFEDRLILQKAVYLAQEAGIQLGYRFNWYIRGPYGSALADDGFALDAAVRNKDDEYKSWRLDAVSAGKLDKISPLMEVSTNKTEKAKRLELLASVHFLITRKQVKDKNADRITEILHNHNKTWITSYQVEKAVGELEQYELIS